MIHWIVQLDKTQSTPGTANETGNGLGLILCQEFAKKQGTTIRVTSTPKKEVLFRLCYPLHNLKLQTKQASLEALYRTLEVPLPT